VAGILVILVLAFGLILCVVALVECSTTWGHDAALKLAAVDFILLIGLPFAAGLFASSLSTGDQWAGLFIFFVGVCALGVCGVVASLINLLVMFKAHRTRSERRRVALYDEPIRYQEAGVFD